MVSASILSAAKFTTSVIESMPGRNHPQKASRLLAKIRIHADRYEYWIYQQLYKHFRNGAVYLKNSIRHRAFNDELIPKEEVSITLKELGIPWGQKPIGQQLDELLATLHGLWVSFNKALKQGNLKHLHYDTENKLLSWRKPRTDSEPELTQDFYSQLPFKDRIDVLRFVNKECHFLSALVPLQPRLC